jgi:SNF2 family DNA or RNA helicase
MLIFIKAKIPGSHTADIFAENVNVGGYTTKEGTYVAPHTAIRHKRHTAPAIVQQPTQHDLFSAADKPAAPAQLGLFDNPMPHAEEERPTAAQKYFDAMQRRHESRQALAVHLAAAGRPVKFTTDVEGQTLLAGPDMSKPGGFRVTRFDGGEPSGHYENETLQGAIYDALKSGARPVEPEPEAAAVAADEQEPKTESTTPATTTPKTEKKPKQSAVKLESTTLDSWGVAPGVTKRERKALNAAALDILASKTDDEMTPDDLRALSHYSGRGGVGDSLNEFYTDPAVASAMWSILASAGFKGGEVLEPSSGIGVFMHTAPEGARVTAVEIDPTSARIAGLLARPNGHEVHNSSLERFATQDGRLFDAVIGNVPFGVRGSTVADDKPDLATCERYFFDTALDKTKDGGVVAFIVPTGIMDSKTGRAFRESMLTKGEFLGAHRLPNTAFEASHTEVTSDIVILRKRPQEIAGALGALEQGQLREIGVWDTEFLAGQYFTTGRGAKNVMGSLEKGWRAKANIGDDITVTGSMQGVPEALSGVTLEDGGAKPSMADVLAVVGDDPKERQRVISASLKPPYQVAKVGDTKTQDGVLYVLQGDPPRWHRASSETPEAVTDAIRIGEAIDALARDKSGKPMALARADLAADLDNYVRLHGLPQGNKKLAAWLNAPSLPIADGADEEEHASHVSRSHRAAAQILGAVRKDGSYSDLITGGAGDNEAASLEQAALNLALERGGFTPEELARAYGKGDEQAIRDYLFASPEYAVNADGRNWTTLDEYLSGELWPKYDAAKEALAHEGIAPEYKAKYQAQIDALDKAIDPQSLETADVTVNAGFITPEIITAWLAAKAANQNANYPNRSWKLKSLTVTFDGGLYRFHNEDGAEGAGWGDDRLLEKYLNRTGVRKDEQDAVARLNDEFRDWLLGSEYRDQVEDLYNRTYRGFRQRGYSDAPFAIPGLNPALDVNNYHFSGLRWALEAGKGIIADDVGLGKTGRGLMLAKLAKVNGKAKHPAFVVPKSVLANWVKESQFWFPGSKVLVIGETYKTGKDGKITSTADTADIRRQKFHDLKQNDYDFVFISQPAWNELDVDPITKGEYVNGDFWTQRGDALGNAGDKRLNKIRESYDQALAKKEFGSRENTLYFGDTGIDMLLMDEGHAYKNLFSARNRFGESPKFLGAGKESNRAQDTYFKTRQLRESNGGKNVYMLTATPTKNSPLEVYSMLHQIAPEAFERMGIKNSEDFIERFCEFKNDTILNVQGKIEDTLVTSGFKNLGELREVMGRYISRRTAEEVGLKLPETDRLTHFVEMTGDQKRMYVELRERAAASQSDDTGDGHIFSIMTEMGKVSIDPALVYESHANIRSPKVEACTDKVKDGLVDGGQIVFCDHVDMHERIAQSLVRKGIPREQIGIINAKSAKSSADRQRISDDFNSGKLTVVIGNTATMGEGVNLQKRTADIHHLDLPWEPASMQQRDGRGRRQGNTNKGIRIHTYLAKGSFDGYRYQTIQSKKDWQTLLWHGGDRVENLAREGAFSRSDLMIMLSADPEEARAKYESDKDAAEQRRLAEGRSDALSDFAKMQKMAISRAELVAKKVGSDSLTRLDRRIEILRARLSDNKYFIPKHALDAPHDTLVEPSTMHAYTVGSRFELAAGDDGPINWSWSKPSTWKIIKVMPDANRIVAAVEGEALYVRDVTMDFDKFKSGVTPLSGDEPNKVAA